MHAITWVIAICSFIDLLPHQIYCLEYRLRGSENDLGRTVSQKGGLNVVSYLLVSNEHLAPENPQWLCVFPSPLNVLFIQIQAFQRVHVGWMRCLEKMADGWNNLENHSRRLVTEILEWWMRVVNREVFFNNGRKDARLHVKSLADTKPIEGIQTIDESAG